MKKLLLLLKNLPVKHLRCFSAVLLLMVLLGIQQRSQAQVYYVTNDGTSASTSSQDGMFKINYDGTSKVALGSGFTNSPGIIAIDLPHDRAFVYEQFSSSPPANLGIKVITLSTGALQRTITYTQAARIASLKYDAVNDYIYYVLQDAAVSTASATNDALCRVKPDGTGQTVLLTGFCKNPGPMALDIPNNRLFVMENLNADRAFLTINLSNNTVSQTSSQISILGIAGIYLDYDPDTDFLYLLSSDNNVATTATDAIYKLHTDGSGFVSVKGSIGSRPTSGAFDFPHGKAYFFDNNTTRQLNSMDLTSGAITEVTNINTYPANGQISGIAVPSRPVISTISASSVSAVSATLGGNVVESDVSVTDRGVVYSSSNTTPTIGGGGVIQASNGSGTGAFSASIGSLGGATTYYVRAYATSTAGTAYGAVNSFTTLSNDATLFGLSLSAGSLNPSFSSGTIGYTTTVANNNSTITVTPTKNNANASIKVQGTTVASGTASGNINLNIGDNAISTVVTAQDGSTTKTYTVTVTRPKASQTITFTALPGKTYGNSDFAAGASASSGLGVSYTSDNTAVATIVGGNIHIVAAGTANITASQAGDASNLAATNVSESLTVSKASVTVTATAASKTYGDIDPALVYAVTGGALVSGDVFTGALTRDAGANAGNYNITQGTLALSANYTLLFIGNTFTIGQKAINVTANAQTKTYGDTDPTLTYTADALATGDTFTGALTRATGETVGTHNITQGSLALSGNYALHYTGNTLTIGQKAINVTANAQTKTYGDADPRLTYTADALVTGDSFTGLLTRDAGEAVGTYNITQGSLALSGNYALHYTGNTLTIGQKTINVTANAQSKTYGDADPTLTYAADALATGDSFTGALTRATGEAVGSYAINRGSLALNANYILNYTGNSLTIGQKTINVTANAQSKTYGEADPTLTYTADALATGDNFNGVLTRATGEAVGSYAINQGSLALNANYILNYTGNNLSIGPKTINVTANAQTKTYGDADPTLTYTADALVTGDSFTGLLTRAAGETVGTYSITQGSLALSGNYALHYTGNTLSIGQKTINVTANAQSKTYGDADPTLTYTADALASGDSFSGLLTRDAGEAVGSYNINQGSLALNANYALNYAGNSLSIGKATLSYVATAVTKTYLAPNPVFTGSVTGFINGDTQNSATTGTLTFTSTATGSSVQGSYPVNGSGLSAVNYSFIQSPANSSALTVTLSSDAALSNITISQGALNIPFDANTYQYSASVDQSVSSFDLTATLRQPYATMTVNGTQLTSGTATTLPLSGGANNFVIATTAQDGSSTQTYTLIISKPVNSVGLKVLAANQGTLTHLPNSNNYVVGVGSGSNSIIITAVPVDNNATMTINGAVLSSGVASAPISLPSFTTNISVDVTAQDGVTKRTYSIAVNKSGSNNIGLKTLATNIGSIVHTFSTNNYIVGVSSLASSIMVVAEPIDANATMKINGVTLSSGVQSAPISLPAYSTTVNVDVTAEDGVTQRTYVIAINKSGSNNAGLSVLGTSAGSIVHTFGTDGYIVGVGSGVNTITVTAAPADVNATMKINGVALTSGIASDPISLPAYTTNIAVEVTAEDGTTVRTFTIAVNKSGSNNAGLSSLAANLGAMTHTLGTDNYTVGVGSGVSSIMITAAPVESHATMTINGVTLNSNVASGPISLPAYTTNINVVVTAEDGVTQRTFAIAVNKSGSNNAGLKVLGSSIGAIVHTLGTDNYTVGVSAGATSLTITAAPVDVNATMSINGVTLNSGIASNSIALPDFTTVINVNVTAEDGVTQRTYAITVNKSGSNNAGLKSLYTSLGSVTQVASTDRYNIGVASTAGSISVTAVTSDVNATMQLRESTLANNVASAPVTLSTDTTIINVNVTAEDGITQRIFSISVNKAPIVGLAAKIVPVEVNKTPQAVTEGIIVHQAVSPNGDGFNDYLNIEGIEKYVDNHLSIMNAGGALIYDVKGYGSNGNLFDGHSNKSGSLQKPGTYYYSLEYKDGSETKHKTGFIILKY